MIGIILELESCSAVESFFFGWTGAMDHMPKKYGEEEENTAHASRKQLSWRWILIFTLIAPHLHIH